MQLPMTVGQKVARVVGEERPQLGQLFVLQVVGQLVEQPVQGEGGDARLLFVVQTHERDFRIVGHSRWGM